MKAIINQYKENIALFECMVSILIFLIIFLFSYFLLLRPEIYKYHINKKRFQLIHVQFEKKTTEKTAESALLNQLTLWKKKHPRFYQSVHFFYTHPDLTEQLTTLAQQSQFLVTHIHYNLKANYINIKATGGFASLFTLITQLNHNPLPLLLTQLNIHHPNQYTMQFTLEGWHAKK